MLPRLRGPGLHDSCLFVSPEVASATLGWVRETSFRRAPGPRGADHPAEAGPTVGVLVPPSEDDWGRRGVSVSLGRGRPRRCAKAGLPPSVVLRAWSGPQAVSSVRRARGRRGPHKRRATFAVRSVVG